MKIGLSKSIISYNGFDYDSIDHGWYKTLIGHSLFFVPNTMNQDFDLMANDLDSFILTGGEYTDTRKSVELTLVNKMLERNKPIVGIAEGAFLVAELLGGTFEPINNHLGLDHPIFYHREVLEVNSYHDKCIKTLPNTTDVLCMDYLGNIEAFISGNSAGVVWNPEKMKNPWIPPEIAYVLRI
jgi:gamma-glutamyl-gamma-aminobutyrate hydrolase PuuD